MDDYPVPSPESIRQSIDVLFAPDDVIEIRAIGSDRTEFGYFDPAHRDDLVRAAIAANKTRSNIYFPINPVLPDLLARSANRMRRAGKRDAATGDAGILRRTWLPIDIDPERPSGISSTDEEKQAARHVARVVVGYLRSIGWPDPVIGDSGNGLHVLYRIDLPADDGARDLVRSVLIAMAERFDAPAAKIDRSVFNAARIWKTYGTVACKGDHVPGRPHRAAALLQVPDTVGVVTEDMLRSFIVQVGGMNGAERSERRNGTHHPVASPFQAVNESAMARLGAWVPSLLPMAKPYHDGFRVSASDLDRGLEEDVSFVPAGIRDFGQEDGLSPIDAVMRFGGHSRPAEAAQWLAGQLGMAWEVRGRQGPAGAPQEAPAGGGDDAPVDEIPIEAYWDDPGAPGVGAKQQAPKDAALIGYSAFMAKQRPADWIVQGMVQRGSLYACTAPTNHGKTAVMQHLFLCLAAGRRFCGLEITRCRVAILCGENQDGFRARLMATAEGLGIAEEDVEGWMYIYDAAAPLGVILDLIRESMEGIGEFGAILIDTSVAYFGGDKEDDNVQALVHARLMRQLCEAPGRPAVIANAHPTKNVLDRESCVPRGGSSFLNEIDTNLSVWSEGGSAVLHWTRKKRGPDFEPIAFEFVACKVQDCGLEVDAVWARWIDDKREENIRRDLAAKENLLLRTMIAYPKASISALCLRGGFVTQDGAPQKSSVVGMLKRLESFKLVGRNRYGWHLTEAGIKEAKS